MNFLATVYVEGRQAIPYYEHLKVYVPVLLALYGLKSFFAGPRNKWDRDMHGRVILITGGTSGLGAITVKELAGRGAQIILLVKNTKDGWLTDFVDDLRESTRNPLIFAEECDLANFHSVRSFATKWIDNLPPRRLDAVVCCAAVTQPPTLPRQATIPDGLEPQYQVNYLSHYLLLSILSPAIRSQPPDREVRIVLVSCVSSVMAEFNLEDLGYVKRKFPVNRPHLVSGEAKLCLALTGFELQRQFDNYERKDNAPPNVHVAVVDPGIMRSPGFKRYITCGRVWMLVLYTLLWPIWWLFLKSSVDGAQSVLYALMSPDVAIKEDVAYISDSRIRAVPPRSEFGNAEKQQKLFAETAKLIESTEKASAVERNRLKPQTTEKEPATAKGKARAADLLSRAKAAAKQAK